MNVYLDLAKLKDELGIAKPESNAQLMRLLNRSSRVIDNYCGRHFYMKTSTKTARTIAGYYHQLQDLYSISTITLDDVGIVEDTKLRMLNSLFTNRQKLVIAGIWGYEEMKDDSGDTIQDDPLSAGATTVNVTNGGNFAIGQTLKLEDEQSYITAINADALSVKRGVNGTTAAEHANGTAIYIYTYPEPIAQACLVQTIRWYRGKDAAWGDEVGIDQKLKYAYEPHPSVRVLLNPYRRITGGGF
jgi:hypothetical protein